MRLKTIVKLFIPPIFIRLKDFVKILFGKVIQKNCSSISKIKIKRSDLVVIGNGPSLTESMRKYKKEICRFDSIVVNMFCTSDYYSVVKPSYYLIADPSFFGDLDGAVDWLRERVLGLIDALVSKTQWDINLIVPASAFNSFFIKEVSKNTFIHPFYYNDQNLVKCRNDNKFKLWDNNLIAPPAQTCLNVCVWLGIFLRYVNVYIIGADSNWIELLNVDQKTNELFICDKHFYGQSYGRIVSDSSGNKFSNLHEELLCQANVFMHYCELKAYADYAGVKVYNASEYSLIDAFERKKLIQ